MDYTGDTGMSGVATLALTTAEIVDTKAVHTGITVLAHMREALQDTQVEVHSNPDSVTIQPKPNS